MSKHSPHDRKARPSRMERWLVRWFLLGGLLYVGFVVLLAVSETRLVYPAPVTDAEAGSKATRSLGGESFMAAVPSGGRVHGVYFPRANAEITLIYFHGNAEDVATSQAWLKALGSRLNASVMVFDYRGYGQSHGTPGQAGVVDDGVAAVDWLSERTGQASDTMLFLGMSLGGGVAVQVAAQRAPRGLVLVSTFDSLAAVGQGHFPWLPVRWVMRNRFDSAEILEHLEVPVLQIHGDQDRVVPMPRGQALFERIQSPHKRWMVAAGYGHNDLPLLDWAEEIIRFARDPSVRERPGRPGVPDLPAGPD